MAIEGLNHCNVLTDDVDASLRFCNDVLAVEIGPRPQVNSPDAWLYSNAHLVLHVSGERSRAELTPRVLDHIACTASDLAATLGAPKAHAVTAASRTWRAKPLHRAPSTSAGAR